jgi:hypothetical protein
MYKSEWDIPWRASCSLACQETTRIVWKQNDHYRLHSSGVPRGRLGVQPPSWNSKVLTKLNRIPSSMENTSVTTLSDYGFHSFANWLEPLATGLSTPDPRSLCPLSSTKFVELPSPEKISGLTPRKNSWVRHCFTSNHISGITGVWCSIDETQLLDVSQHQPTIGTYTNLK